MTLPPALRRQTATVLAPIYRLDVAPGKWYRRGPPCHICGPDDRQGVIFEESQAEAPFEQCAVCTAEIDVSHYGDRQTGRVDVLVPCDFDDIQRNPWLNPEALKPKDAQPRDLDDYVVEAGLHDIANGKRLVALFGTNLRHTKHWGWVVYDGRRWMRDDIGAMTRFAKATVNRMVELVNTPVWGFQVEKAKFAGWAFTSHSRGKVEAMLAMAESEPGIAARVEEFDQHSWLLNCRNGVLDLQGGVLRPHEPDLYFTQVVPHNYSQDATCPRWLQFIDEVTAGDKELADYLQKAVGYTLTGEVREQKLFFLYGDGANGKSTFLEVLRHLLGDYGTQLSFETFLRSKTSRGEEGFAPLPGKRFAVANEAGESRAFNEEAIKSVTGGDTIRARLLYQDSFEFRPVAKIWLAANERPRIDGVNEGIWRRFHMIPFTAEFSPEKRDGELLTKLRGESEGILSWAARGAYRWYREGLRPIPKAIDSAIQDYRSDNDAVSRFIADCCDVAPHLSETAANLRQAYEAWAKANGERSLTQMALGTRLSKYRGGKLEKARGTGGRIRWHGIMLRSTHEREDGFASGLAAYDRPSPTFSP